MTTTKTETTIDVQCQCGEYLGECCAWSGPLDSTVMIEIMPDHLRATHAAAGNSGTYPGNGALRLRVEKTCAKRLADDWCWIVDRP